MHPAISGPPLETFRSEGRNRSSFLTVTRRLVLAHVSHGLMSVPSGTRWHPDTRRSSETWRRCYWRTSFNPSSFTAKLDPSGIPTCPRSIIECRMHVQKSRRKRILAAATCGSLDQLMRWFGLWLFRIRKMEHKHLFYYACTLFFPSLKISVKFANTVNSYDSL